MRGRLWNLQKPKEEERTSVLQTPPFVAVSAPHCLRFSALQSRGPDTLKEITPVGGLSAVSLLVSLQHLEIVHMVAWDRSASAPKKLFT